MKKKTKKAKPKKKLKAKVKPKAKKAARPKANKAKKAAPKKAKAKTKKKTGAPKAKMAVIPPANSTLVGRVEDYYAHINVIALTLKAPVNIGDHLHVLGHTTNLEQTVDSMQINHQSVTQARANDAVGIKISSRARKGDYVFTIRG